MIFLTNHQFKTITQRLDNIERFISKTKPAKPNGGVKRGHMQRGGR